MDFIALGEQKLDEVRTVLTCAASDDSLLHGIRLS
jgi:hypothetical protein